MRKKVTICNIFAEVGHKIAKREWPVLADKPGHLVGLGKETGQAKVCG
jgi:hypothetical protein